MNVIEHISTRVLHIIIRARWFFVFGCIDFMTLLLFAAWWTCSKNWLQTSTALSNPVMEILLDGQIKVCFPCFLLFIAYTVMMTLQDKSRKTLMTSAVSADFGFEITLFVCNNHISLHNKSVRKTKITWWKANCGKS